jgi:hypothetical protein
MKQKRLSKKLKLSKTTIARLKTNEMKENAAFGHGSGGWETHCC